MVELKTDQNVPSNIIQYKMSIPRSTSNPNTGGMFSKFKFNAKNKTIMSPANFSSIPAKKHYQNLCTTPIVKSTTNQNTGIDIKMPLTMISDKNPVVVSNNAENVEKPKEVFVNTLDAMTKPSVKTNEEKISCTSNDKNNNTDISHSKKPETEIETETEVHNISKQQHVCENNNSNVVPSSNNSKRKKIFLDDVHPYITCTICKGYLIDPCAIIECGHSFCHSCLMKHLLKENFCPLCKIAINKSKTNIKYDATMQAIVFKLVPGLYEKELKRKRAFYRSRPEEAKLCSPEQRGEDTEHLIFGPSDNISVSIAYADELDDDMKNDENVKKLLQPIYLCAPAIFRVEHLKKFIVNKFAINTNIFSVEISYKVRTIVLPDHYTLMDVCYIYKLYPVREAPMAFFFRIIPNDTKTKKLDNETTSIDAVVVVENSNKDEIKSDPDNAACEPNINKTDVVKKDTIKMNDVAVKNGDLVSCSDESSKNSDNSVKTDPIKLKLNLKNLVSNGTTPSSKKLESKTEQKLKKKLEKLEKKIKIENELKERKIATNENVMKKAKHVPTVEKQTISKSTANNDNKVVENSKVTDTLLNENDIKKEKDEYEFEDEIDQQKLGFLNTFELTIRKNIIPKKPSEEIINKLTSEKSTPMVSIPKGEIGSSVKNSNTPTVNKRKNKEPVKTVPKKYKSNEMKTMSEGDKFLMKKMREGKEITFDLSPKPLGTKPAPAKITMEMIQAMNAERAAEKLSADKNTKELHQMNDKPQPQLAEKPQHSEKPQTINNENSNELKSNGKQSELNKTENCKPVMSLPALKPITFLTPPKPSIDSPSVPKSTATVKNPSPPIKFYTAPKSESELMKPPQFPTIKPKKLPLLLPKKPEVLMAVGSNPEISVTRINDGNGNRKVYGPKQSSEASNKSPKSSPDGFLFPYPPKSTHSQPYKPPHKVTTPPPPNFMAGFDLNGSSFKPPNPSTPFPRTPFYSPNSPIYTPGSYDTKPQYKYTNPLHYTSFFNNMLHNLPKSPMPQTQNKPQQTDNKMNGNPSSDNNRKHKSPSPDAVPAKKKTPDNTPVKQESETPTTPMSVLKNITFPPSLSVSFITNEQEQEQIRNLKQNVVNNNIEIIKLPDAEEKKDAIKSPVGSASSAAKNLVDKKEAKSSETLTNEPPLPPPVQAALSETKETFQKKFLESILNSNKKQPQPRTKKSVMELSEKKANSSATNSMKKSMAPPQQMPIIPSPSSSSPPTPAQLPFPDLAWMGMAMNNMNILNNPFALQRQILLEQLKKNVERQNLLHNQMKNTNSPNTKK